jgi:hypothetical protein
MRRRRGLTLLASPGLSGALLGLVPVPAPQASCVGPVVAVGDTVDDARRPDSGVLPAPGADVTVSGVWFHTGCDDTGPGAGQGAGCSAFASTEAPMRDVDLCWSRATRPGPRDPGRRLPRGPLRHHLDRAGAPRRSTRTSDPPGRLRRTARRDLRLTLLMIQSLRRQRVHAVSGRRSLRASMSRPPRSSRRPPAGGDRRSSDGEQVARDLRVASAPWSAQKGQTVAGVSCWSG